MNDRPTIAAIGGAATLAEREGLALGTHEVFEGAIVPKAEAERIRRERAFPLRAAGMVPAVDAAPVVSEEE